MKEEKAEGSLGSGKGMRWVMETLVSGAGRAECGSKCLLRGGCHPERTFLPWMWLGIRFTALGLLQDSKSCVLSRE